jgi:hypothetical protein
MVHRKRTFTEIDGQKLLDAIGAFRRSLFEAGQNAPFRSEIHDAIESLSQAIRQVEITLTGDPSYGRIADHSTSFTPPPVKILKLRTWKTSPLWKLEDSK